MALLYEMSGTAEFRRQGAYIAQIFEIKNLGAIWQLKSQLLRVFFDVHSCNCLTISNIKTKSNTQIGAIYRGYGQTKNG